MVFSDAAAHEQRFHQCDAIRSCIFSCSFLALLLGRFRRRRRHRFALGIGNLGSNQGSHTGSRSLRNAATAQNLCRCQGIAANGECNKKLHHNCIHCAVGSAATSSCHRPRAMTGSRASADWSLFHGQLKLRFKCVARVGGGSNPWAGIFGVRAAFVPAGRKGTTLSCKKYIYSQVLRARDAAYVINKRQSHHESSSYSSNSHRAA